MINKEFVKKILANLLQVAIVFVVIFGALIFFEYSQQKNHKKEELSKIVLYHKSPEGKLIKILGETNQNYEGNRYVVQDITLGGETLMAMLPDDKTSGIELSHFQGKLYEFSEDESISYYASWRSNKPTLSAISYKKEQDFEWEEASEDDFSYAHTMALPGIDFSSVYNYTIKSRDRWGKEMETGQFVFYTGAPDISFFRLLEESLGEIFGWMVK